MASILPGTSIFVEVSQQIRDTFDELIKQLIARRDQLLAEVNVIKLEFEERLKSQEETLTELEKIKKQIEQISSKQNLTSDLLQSSLIPIQKQINEMSQPPNLKFECSVKEITDRLRGIGNVKFGGEMPGTAEKPLAIDYAIKAVCVKDIFERGCQMMHAVGNELYLVYSSKIRVFDIPNCKFKFRNFSLENKSSLYAVATNLTHCYVTASGYNRYCIYKLDRTDFSVIKKEDRIPKMYNGKTVHYSFFINLAIIEEEIFVTVSHINVIYVFDLDLCYRRDFTIPNTPKYIQSNKGKLYVLDEGYSLNIFNTLGQIIGSSHEFFKLDSKPESNVELPKHQITQFCFDTSGNAVLLVEDNSLVVISPEGEKIYELGEGFKEGFKKDCTHLS